MAAGDSRPSPPRVTRFPQLPEKLPHIGDLIGQRCRCVEGVVKSWAVFGDPLIDAYSELLDSGYSRRRLAHREYSSRHSRSTISLCLTVAAALDRTAVTQSPSPRATRASRRRDLAGYRTGEPKGGS